MLPFMTSSSSKTLRCQITLHNHEILALEGIIFNQPKSLYKPGSKVYTESCVKVHPWVCGVQGACSSWLESVKKWKLGKCL